MGLRLNQEQGNQRGVAGGDVKKQGLGTRGWGLGDEGLHVADACQHHPPNSSLGSKRCRNSKKEFLF